MRFGPGAARAGTWRERFRIGGSPRARSIIVGGSMKDTITTSRPDVANPSPVRRPSHTVQRGAAMRLEHQDMPAWNHATDGDGFVIGKGTLAVTQAHAAERMPASQVARSTPPPGRPPPGHSSASRGAARRTPARRRRRTATAKFRAGTWMVMGSCKNSPCKSSDGAALAWTASLNRPRTRQESPCFPNCWGYAKTHDVVTVHHISAATAVPTKL